MDTQQIYFLKPKLVCHILTAFLKSFHSFISLTISTLESEHLPASLMPNLKQPALLWPETITNPISVTRLDLSFLEFHLSGIIEYICTHWSYFYLTLDLLLWFPSCDVWFRLILKWVHVPYTHADLTGWVEPSLEKNPEKQDKEAYEHNYWQEEECWLFLRLLECDKEWVHLVPQT